MGHALWCAPEEACGLLAADASGRVRMAYCLTNLDASPVSYTLDPAEHVGALRHAERRGWHLAAVFHSHPRGAPVPSPTDVARALEPDWVYVVIGLGGSSPGVRGFRIAGGRVSEEPLTVPEAA